MCPDGSSRRRCDRDVAELDRSLVAGLPVFSGFAPPELDQILGEARLQRVPKNATVFEQGAEADSFFVLLHGRVRAVKATPEGDASTSVRLPHAGLPAPPQNHSDFAAVREDRFLMNHIESVESLQAGVAIRTV